MKQEFRLGQKMQHRMVMTPMLQQAMKILQLSTLELKEWVEKEMTENPALEEEAEETASPDGETGASPSLSREEQDSQENRLFEGSLLPTHRSDLVGHLKEDGHFGNEAWGPDGGASDYEGGEGEWGERESDAGAQEKRDFAEASLSRIPTLTESLEWQLMMATPHGEEQALGKVLIGNLDENGYLACSLEDIAESEKKALSQVEKVLRLIQTFDPPGVGARDLRECLFLQLENRTGEPAQRARQVISRHFEDMEKKRYLPILRDLKCSEEQLREVLRFISALEPKPGRSFEATEPKYLVPDVVVRKVEGEYVVTLNDESVPRVRVSPYYRKLLKDKRSLGNKEAKSFVEGKIQSAQWLIRNIEQRRKTIHKVAETIFQIQRGFLEEGVSALRPLTLKEVADQIGMHESTVSRVTNHKYAETPRGIFELKYFFTSSLETADGSDVSSSAVKEKIRELVGQEPPQRPLSDEKITKILKEGGFSVARRTVAKYREALRILPASRRRKL